MRKVGRNDLCPCGSGEKYKKCHLISEDIHDESYMDSAVKTYRHFNKDKRIRQCLYPDHTSCTSKIIRAHSIQNSKIVQRISENGNVYMNRAKPNNPFAVFTKWGRKEATTFTGFCDYHDKVLFQPIEDKNFDMSEEQVLLHTYRCLTANIHDKQENVKFGESVTNTFALPRDSDVGLLSLGNSLAVDDFLHEKTILDKALINRDFDVVDSIVWEFDFPIQFAGSAFEAPTRDLKNRKIQDLETNDIIAHLFITIFPEDNKSYCIISWIKALGGIFNELIGQIKGLNAQERKNYLNSTLVKNSDNLVFSPKLIETMSKNEVQNFGFISQGAYLFDAFFESVDKDFFTETSRIEVSDPGYDLFKTY
ncbi:SEC-C domain-containing protein [Listeria booriae]|uniref:SEC-C domain-containing protein n=1 Tax=Listeria booriae TaxID=1552123 RepID=A0A842B815_9LIST|nr:SEC-C domain-containing protein [Listeria booriae]MBC1797975.1 SEC-C domain-containing protein [Listeria booriae]